MKNTFKYSEDRMIFAKEKFSPNDIAEVIKETVRERYRGLIDVETESELDGYVNISADRLAHFLKLLLMRADQSCFIRIRFSATRSCFSISIRESEKLTLERELAYELMHYAKQAGFVIIIDESKIILDAPLSLGEEEVFAIYARTRYDIKKIFEKIFDEN